MFFVLPFVIQINGKQLRIGIKAQVRPVQVAVRKQPGPVRTERGFGNGRLRRLLSNPSVN
jgi:hypothetical protein